MKPTDLSIDDYYNAVKIFHDESDRAAAVLAGSLIENYLAKYLISFMIDDKKVLDLFDGFGPFASYSQRVSTAYAFGYITKEQKNDLDYIGKIRNHFAHHPHEATFDREPVCSFCQILSANTLFPLPGQQSNPISENRYRYLFAINKLIFEWDKAMLATKDRS